MVIWLETGQHVFYELEQFSPEASMLVLGMLHYRG